MSTTSKSRSFSRKGARLRPDRPFDRAILEQARAFAQRYQVVLWTQDGEWYGRGVEFPDAMNDGKTPEECIANTREMFVTTVAVMLEQGMTPPPPADEGVRNEQMNIRLSAEERLRLVTAAKQRGFEGVSDFVRTAALRAASN
jgi:predicted RNase H-like HicB family nuclease